MWVGIKYEYDFLLLVVQLSKFYTLDLERAYSSMHPSVWSSQYKYIYMKKKSALGKIYFLQLIKLKIGYITRVTSPQF